ncbi:Ig-like domain-containing protein [Sedimentibacter hydroxybenzoicus DSM 7310]|uniref:Ig-like domain-containing protein n=1 Tax=Sedimentibacter hydroxybenzoicus DSM 7310 TaxID=1123245 RepID=A0A974GUW1_SEDHY|nr:Ig-like domain-containing protein [Sedimentibacter hydroxybenzoicus]NYB72743.1 Ig-like domain-containing protein [Sedimentibacter hydroxybenzoicus DSM 7310]
MIRKSLSLLLIFAMIFSIAMPVNAFAITKDYAGHWAEETINTWLNKGYVSGYPDGSFKPEGSVTRAEFITMVNKLFSYSEISDISFTDVNLEDWYYKEVQKSVKAGYISGLSETKFAPDEKLTREQAAVIISKIMELQGKSAGADIFTDKNEISGWALEYVGASANAQIIKGYDADNTFRPQNPIKRAEAISMLDRIVESTESADLIIDKAGTVVENKTYNNIHITNKVGNGEVTLKNVTVTGELLVEGGGENSIIIENSTINVLVTNKKDGKVRILATGSTEVYYTSVLSGVTLEQDELTGKGFEQVVVDEDANENQTITVNADLGELSINAKVKINIKSGEIEEIVIAKDAEGASINLGNSAKALLITVNAKVSFTGVGTIITAEINASEVTFEKKPENTDVAPGVKAPEIKTPSSGGGGSSGPSGPSQQVLNIEITLSDSLVHANETDFYPYIQTISLNNQTIYNDKEGRQDLDEIISMLKEQGITLKFKSDDTSIVSIDETTGKMTGKAVGETIITVTASKSGYNNKAFDFDVEVIIPVNEVEISATTTSTGIGGKVQLEAVISPKDATYKDVAWESSDDKIAAVDAKGLVTGVSTGSAIITVTTKEGRKTDSVVIEVKESKEPETPDIPVSGITINEADQELEVGEKLQLTIKIEPEDATNQDVTWESSDDTIATVSANGLVTAVTEGEATITVTTEDGNKMYSVVIAVVVEEPQDPEELTATIDEITGDSNTLSGTFNKPVFVDGVALGSVNVSNDTGKIAFIDKLFNAPTDLSTYMDADKVEIVLTDTSVSVTIKDGAISEELFKTLDGDGNGIWRMDIELNKDNFIDADNQTVVEVPEAFKIKFFVPSANGIADYSVPVKAVFQTQDQRDAEGDGVVAPEALTVAIDEVTGSSNTLKGIFNKSVFVDGVALDLINVETSEDKIAFLDQLFNAPVDLTEVVNADNITINLTDRSVEVIVNDDVIKRDLFKALDTSTTGGTDIWSGNDDGIYRMDIELEEGNFKDIHGNYIEAIEGEEQFKLKFSSLSSGMVNYDAPIKAVFQTQAQRDAEVAVDTGISISVDREKATAEKATIEFSSTRTFGTSETKYTSDMYTKNGTYMLLRLYKVDGESEEAVFFNTVYDGLTISSGLGAGLKFGDHGTGTGRLGADFGLGTHSGTKLFSDASIKNSTVKGALIYDVKTSDDDVFGLWLPAGSINLTVEANLKTTEKVAGNYKMVLEAYESAYKLNEEGNQWVKYSDTEELPLLESVDIITFTVE